MDTESTETTLLLERGGCLHLGPAASDGVLCQQVQMAIGISTLFKGRLVDIRHWLPGLVLKVQARRDRNNGERISLEADWPALHRKLTSWIEAPADADMLDLSNDDAYCALVPDTFDPHVHLDLRLAASGECLPWHSKNSSVMRFGAQGQGHHDERTSL